MSPSVRDARIMNVHIFVFTIVVNQLHFSSTYAIKNKDRRSRRNYQLRCDPDTRGNLFLYCTVNRTMMSGVVVSGSSTSSSSSSGSSLSQSSVRQIISPGRQGSLNVDTGGLTVKDSEAVEYYCGIGRCRPKWMQIFRRGKVFTFILCLYCCIEGALVSGMSIYLSLILIWKS